MWFRWAREGREAPCVLASGWSDGIIQAGVSWKDDICPFRPPRLGFLRRSRCSERVGPGQGVSRFAEGPATVDDGALLIIRRAQGELEVQV